MLWWTDLARANREGTFLYGLTAFVVAGTKPDLAAARMIFVPNRHEKSRHETRPNIGLRPTTSSVRSCLAPASASGSD